MTTLQLTIICVTVLVLALIVARGYGERVGVLNAQLADSQHQVARAATERDEALDAVARAGSFAPALGATVGVHLPGGEMVRGELAGCDDATLVLDKAELVVGGSAQPLGGRQHVARSLWIQELS